MYDILLINPPLVDYDHGKIPKFFLKTTLFPSIGLAYLSAYLEKHSFKTHIIDMDAEKFGLSKLATIINEIEPRVIGITIISDSTYHISKQIIMELKRLKNLPIIAGGIFPTHNPEYLLNKTEVDYVIRGEGEKTIVELLDVLINKNGVLKEIKGITYKENEDLISTPSRELIHDLDKIPFPAWYKFSIKRYFFSVAYKHPCLPILASRGCTYRCTFCSSTVFPKCRFRSPKNVVDEIEYLIENFSIKDISFNDSTFNKNPKWVIELCKELITRKIKIKWRCLCRPDNINEKMIAYMKAAGCYYISFGVESSQDKFLSYLKKDFTINQAINAIKITKRYKIEIMANFMYGIPGQKAQDLKHNISFIKKLGLDYINIVILTPFSGSELYEYAKENCLLIENDLESYKNPEKIALQGLIWKLPYLNEEILNYFIKKTYISYFISLRTILKYTKRYLKTPSRLLRALKNTLLRFI